MDILASTEIIILGAAGGAIVWELGRRLIFRAFDKTLDHPGDDAVHFSGRDEKTRIVNHVNNNSHVNKDLCQTIHNRVDESIQEVKQEIKVVHSRIDGVITDQGKNKEEIIRAIREAKL